MKKKMESCLHACLSFSFSFTEKQNDEKNIHLNGGRGWQSHQHHFNVLPSASKWLLALGSTLKWFWCTSHGRTESCFAIVFLLLFQFHFNSMFGSRLNCRKIKRIVYNWSDTTHFENTHPSASRECAITHWIYHLTTHHSPHGNSSRMNVLLWRLAFNRQ